jgi:hypothetical protein
MQGDLFFQALLQHAHPSAKLEIVRPANEQMNVIRHDHVATNGDVVPRVCTLRKFDERSGNWIGREDLSSSIRAGRHEENRIIRHDTVKSRRSSREAPHPVAAPLPATPKSDEGRWAT